MAIVQSVFRIIILCEAVPLNVVNVHHNTSFQSESCAIVVAHALGHVHTFVENVVSTVQSVLYLTILFCVVHHIVVKLQDITTFQSACSKTQVGALFGKKKLVSVVSNVKSSLNTCSLLDTPQLYVIDSDLHTKNFPFALRFNKEDGIENQEPVFQETKDISVASSFNKCCASLLPYFVKAPAT